MLASPREIIFPKASWIEVESRAEIVGQTPAEYVDSTIALGLRITRMYWSHVNAGHKTHLLFEKAPQANTFAETTIDFKDNLPDSSKVEFDEMPADPFANDLVGIEVDPELRESIVFNAQALGLATTGLAIWFFYFRNAIDKSAMQGRKVLINKGDIYNGDERFADLA